jgi:hypothetical protein
MVLFQLLPFVGASSSYLYCRYVHSWMCFECVLLDTAPLIPLTVTASEYPINVIDNPHVEATHPQLPPSNALIKNNIMLP